MPAGEVSKGSKMRGDRLPGIIREVENASRRRRSPPLMAEIGAINDEPAFAELLAK
jgi:hypothetical protein